MSINRRHFLSLAGATAVTAVNPIYGLPSGGAERSFCLRPVRKGRAICKVKDLRKFSTEVHALADPGTAIYAHGSILQMTRNGQKLSVKIIS